MNSVSREGCLRREEFIAKAYRMALTYPKLFPGFLGLQHVDPSVQTENALDLSIRHIRLPQEFPTPRNEESPTTPRTARRDLGETHEKDGAKSPSSDQEDCTKDRINILTIDFELEEDDVRKTLEGEEEKSRLKISEKFAARIHDRLAEYRISDSEASDEERKCPALGIPMQEDVRRRDLVNELMNDPEDQNVSPSGVHTRNDKNDGKPIIAGKNTVQTRAKKSLERYLDRMKRNKDKK